MLRKFIMAIASIVFVMGSAFADVEVNKANQAALDGIKGIGPAKSKAILAERTKGGDFKDWADLESRVKGIGEKNSLKLSEAGLTVNGKTKSAVSTKKTEEKSESSSDQAVAVAKKDKKSSKSK
jgi:competence protein ComEA